MTSILRRNRRRSGFTLLEASNSPLSLSLSLSHGASTLPSSCSCSFRRSRSISLQIGAFWRSLTEMANRHTIILMQSSPNRATRTFMDYDSISQAMHGLHFPSRKLLFHLGYSGICGLYERKLKELNPTIRNIQYDIADLYNFIDGLTDMSALVFDHSIQAYLPYDREWIKQRTFHQLKKLTMR